MEHSLHIAAKHLVQKVAPRTSKKGDTGPNSEDGGVSDADEDDDDDDDDLEAGDSLGKAIALVKQVSCSQVLLTHFPH